MSSNKQRQVADVLGETTEMEPTPIDALEDVDLELPQEYLLDIMAAELLEHLAVYQKLSLAVRAARHSEDHARAEQMSHQMLYSRMMAALIQRENPGVKVVADEIALLKARQVASQRQALLGEG